MTLRSQYGPMSSAKVIRIQLRSYEISEDHKRTAEVTEELLGSHEKDYGHSWAQLPLIR